MPAGPSRRVKNYEKRRGRRLAAVRLRATRGASRTDFAAHARRSSVHGARGATEPSEAAVITKRQPPPTRGDSALLQLARAPLSEPRCGELGSARRCRRAESDAPSAEPELVRVGRRAMGEPALEQRRGNTYL